jgi:murein DD-endopeptidase MepM/ murein hydrolase activator NlpD
MAWRANFERGRRFGVARERRMADSASAARAIPTGEGGATMTTFWVRTALMGASAMALQACDLPHSQYAPYEGYQTPSSRGMDRPQYPVNADQPTRSADPHDPVARPSQGVTGQPLPPPGPSSANRLMFIDASTEPVLLTEVAYRHARRHSRGRDRGHAVHVNARGRLERSETAQGVKVKKGDTIAALADRYGTTKEAILKANRIRHPHDLAVGATLKIPSEKADEAPSETRSTSRTAASSKPYAAAHGDTLYSLGRRFHVSPKALADLNGLPPNAHLRIGQTVKLPGQEEEAPAAPARRVASVRRRERVHGRFEAPIETQTDTAIGASQPSSVAYAKPPPRSGRNDATPSATMAPDHPVPYASMPGHLASPPERPVVPPYVPPLNLPQAAPPPLDAQVVLAGRGRFVWPVHGALLSGFGSKPGGQRSDGLDISAADGAPVHAAATGDVVYAGDLVPGLGNLVLIKHDDGWITAYAHLSRTEVKIRDHVAQGAEIGLAGQTGGAAQPEVYFEIRYAPTPRDKAKPVDPALLLSNP